MSAETKILLWWFLFAGTHIVGSSVPVRTFLIGKLGNPGFKGVYSLVSFSTFVPLCYIYASHKHAGAFLFSPPSSMRLVAGVLMLLAIIVLAQGLSTPSPLTTQAEMSDMFPSRARGIQRITRHPLNFAFAIFGAADMLSNTFVGDWIFFGGFVIYGLLSAIHQDRRTFASGREAIAQFQSETSVLPFGAILRGTQRLAFGEYNIGALLVSIVLFGLLWYFHPSIFGGYGG